MPTRNRKPAMAQKNDERPTGFINVDLEVRLGKKPRASLIRFLSARLLPMHSEKGLATFEHHESPISAEQGIMQLVEVLQSLPREPRMQWGLCERRVMNIGVQAGLAEHQALFRVGARALRAVADLGAEVVLTIYAPTAP